MRRIVSLRLATSRERDVYSAAFYNYEAKVVPDLASVRTFSDAKIDAMAIADDSVWTENDRLNLRTNA